MPGDGQLSNELDHHSTTGGSRMNGLVLTKLWTTQDAAAKAPRDVRRIAVGLGYGAVDLEGSSSALTNVMSALGDVPSLLKALAGPVGDGRVLLTQYPLGHAPDSIMRLPSRATKVALVHDIEALRARGSLRRDVSQLRAYDVVVAHTEAMCHWVLENVDPSMRTVALDAFDYLVEDPSSFSGSRSSLPDLLYFVGNLRPSKSGFLYQLGTLPVPVHAFGPECDRARLPPTVSWDGMLEMEQPSVGTVAGFGLVWDGTDPRVLDGAAGSYLRYIAPHKLSFYLAMGAPVIVPSGSAVADWVVRNGLGRAVDSVEEAGEVVRACSEAEWARLCDSVEIHGRRLVSGEQTRAALEGALALV